MMPLLFYQRITERSMNSQFIARIQTGSHIVAVIALVDKHRLQFGNRHVEQFRNCKIVGGFTASQDKAERRP